MKIKVKEAKSLKDKTYGLLAYDQAIPMLLKTRFGIHTFGMKFSIDIIVLDKKERVVDLLEDMGANKIFFWNPKYDTIVELPAGTIGKQKIQIGEKIELVFKELD